MTRDSRRIIHIDMGALCAAVEQRDNPRLMGLPVAIGGSRDRGVVAGASHEARQRGVQSAMGTVAARRRCPDVVFVSPRFDVYQAVSQQVQDIVAGYTSSIQPSLDPAYLYVTSALINGGSATKVAEEIQQAIRTETGLPASAGVSFNKFLASLASGHRKPDGLFVITPRLGPVLVESLPVARFHGIGPVIAARMNALGVRTGLDLRRQLRAFLLEYFGKSAGFYHGLARGEDHRPVITDRAAKSLGTETTFGRLTDDWDDAAAGLTPLCAKVWAAAGEGGYARPNRHTEDQVRGRPTDNTHAIGCVAIASLAEPQQITLSLLRLVLLPGLRIRSLGVTLSNLGSTQARNGSARHPPQSHRPVGALIPFGPHPDLDRHAND